MSYNSKDTNKNTTSSTRISKARKELLGEYADAAACLYGALSISEFVDVFNHYEDDKTDIQEATLALQRYIKMKPEMVEYEIYNELIIGPSFQPDISEEDIEELDFLRSRQQSKPRYLPDKSEFLRYADALYREPEKPYTDLKNYILKNKIYLKEGIDGIDGDLLTLQEMIQDGINSTEYLQYFINRGYKLHGIDDINGFMQALMEVHNNTRMFENNGFMPHNLFEKFERPNLMPLPDKPFTFKNAQPKVGRNDSCSCGSGLKYKKCCGK